MKKIISVLLCLAGLTVAAQNKTYLDYIAKYKNIAIREMLQEGIPASITMAQGLLESGAGTSELALKANNHFGIKCAGTWKGRTIYKDDDHKDECFRVYDHPDESYRDHSLFLKRDRYADLFKLKIDDYKGWAKGLKAAGYATDPRYPEKLIKIIEDYKLHELDRAILTEKPGVPISPTGDYAIHKHETGRLPFVVAQEGDNISDISERYDISVKRLMKYNELRYDSQLIPGQNVFFKAKRRSAKQKTYTVKEGDTMYSIAQQFGITLEMLYKRNYLPYGYQPQAGTVLYLRRYNPQMKDYWYK